MGSRRRGAEPRLHRGPPVADGHVRRQYGYRHSCDSALCGRGERQAAVCLRRPLCAGRGALRNILGGSGRSRSAKALVGGWPLFVNGCKRECCGCLAPAWPLPSPCAGQFLAIPISFAESPLVEVRHDRPPSKQWASGGMGARWVARIPLLVASLAAQPRCLSRSKGIRAAGTDLFSV